MRLVGVRFTSRSGDEEKTLAEFRLDPSDPTEVVALSGQGTGIGKTVLGEGVETMYDAALAVEIGRKYGVEMPSSSQVFTTKDGVRLLIALLAVYKGNLYTGTYPVEE